MLYDCHFLNEWRQNFRTQNYFRQETLRKFIDENLTLSMIFAHKKPSALLKRRRKTQSLFSKGYGYGKN